MKLLAPKIGSEDWQFQIQRLAKVHPCLPFAERAVDFIATVSRRVLADPIVRQWPELLVAAHWMRRAHLEKLRESFRADNTVRLARGLVVHFAPSNVDTIFLYSWLISLLMGNSNLVRVSQGRGEQLDYLLAQINEVMDLGEFEEEKERNLIVSYEHDDAVNKEVCSNCSVRVLWGGDHTITALRRIALPPLATDLAFADRFSLAALHAAAVWACSEEELIHLVKRFYNDTFTFDQLACSSPRLIVWTGTESEICDAKGRFWTELECQIKKRQKAYPAIVTMNRVSAVYAYAATGQAKAVASSSLADFPLRVELREQAIDYREFHCGGGLFLEKQLSSLDDIVDTLTSKDQTLSYFGYESAQLKRLTTRLPSRAIDRIVPIGKSLDFSSTWDGINLFHSFTRRVEIE